MQFAYLIMAHDNEWQLKKLLKLLDRQKNDIFLHIDLKAKDAFHFEELKDIVKKARIHIFSKYSVYWGTISQTRCQVFLLKQAIKFHHDYYHLLSGSDLPIKKLDEIECFFMKNQGKQFVHYESNGYCTKENSKRYFLFENHKKLNDLSLNIQRKLKIERHLYCGANWYSITEELAQDFIKNSKRMLAKVWFTRNSDEYILQTFLKKRIGKYELWSEEENNYYAIMRAIDWNRGTPYVWREKDYEELMHSDYLFARKFDEKIDSDIIEMICDYVEERE